MTGKIKFWNFTKGYGFITPDEGGADVFGHISAWQADTEPEIDDRVKFEIETNPRTGKPQARPIELIDG